MALLRHSLAALVVTSSLVVFLTLAIGLAFVRQQAGTLPSLEALETWKPQQGTTILARDGSEMGRHASEFRKFVPLDDIPPHVTGAFLASEDANFFTHAGVDPTAVFRAALSNLNSTGGPLEGGSTITQQVVKNLVLSSEQTYERKIKEALLALRADRAIGKSRILEIYLNEIYLGAGAYGVAAASEIYFGKDLADLSIAEAALIAGLPKAPSAANPFSNPDRAMERRSYVLDRMASTGMITVDQAEAFNTEPFNLADKGNAADSLADPAFAYAEEAARRVLVDNFGSTRVLTEGVEVATTIAPEAQRIVHEQLRLSLLRIDLEHGYDGPLLRGISLPVDWSDPRLAPPLGTEGWTMGVVTQSDADAVVETQAGPIQLSAERLQSWTGTDRHDAILAAGDVVLIADTAEGPVLAQLPEVEGAAVLLDPRNGDILALGGGFSFERSEFNRATQAKRQTGSVFKPFVYLSALELGYDAMSPVLDAPIAIDSGSGSDWRPQEGQSGMGLISLRQALEKSRNLATIRLLHDVGIDPVMATATRLGLNMPGETNYAMGLGAAETTPLDVAEAYAALASGGRRVIPQLFVDAAQPADQSPNPPVVADPIAVAQLTSILEGVTYAGTAASSFADFGHPVAGKTGTTNDARDAWYATYGPEFVLVVWIGNDDFTPLSGRASGGQTAAPVARSILDGLDEAGVIGFAPFTLPDGAETILADRASGMPDLEGDVVEIVRRP